jgi:hypothetical protein
VSAPVTVNPVAGTHVLYTFSGMLPGSIITNCVLTPPVGTAWNLTGNGIGNSAGVTTMVAELVSGPTDLTTVETLKLSCGTGVLTPAYNPGTSTGPATTPITVVMSAWPQGNALGVGGVPTTTGGTPRYAAGSSVGPLTVIIFSGANTGQTTLLLPYVTASSATAPPAGTYNTGVVIANTTGDTASFGTDPGAAVDTAGNLTFSFYPADGSAPFNITPTSGFNTVAGVLPAGRSFIANFSDLLKLIPTPPVQFTGYVIVTANFTHAHGSSFVYGGIATERITSATDVLVLGNPSSWSRNDNFGVVPPVEIVTK